MLTSNKTMPASVNTSANQNKTEKHFAAALDWETSRIETIEQSERRAWKITYSAIIIAILSWVAIVLMIPLKKTIPYVIRVDNATGIPDIVTILDTKHMKYQEVVDKYWLAQYVRAHETYDWYTLQKDYDTVGLLSSPHVGTGYAALFDGKDALDKKFGDSVQATVQIISVVPNGHGIGTVRFIKKTKRLEEDNAGTITRWIATIGYEYRDPSAMKESVRLINPFGFQVLSYRVDPELAGSRQ